MNPEDDMDENKVEHDPDAQTGAGEPESQAPRDEEGEDEEARSPKMPRAKRPRKVKAQSEGDREPASSRGAVPPPIQDVRDDTAASTAADIAARRAATERLLTRRAAHASAIEEIDAELGEATLGHAIHEAPSVRSVAARTRPRRAAAPKPAAKKPGRAGNAKREAPPAVTDLLARVVDALQGKPDGLRSEALREALHAERKDLVLALKHGLASRAIKSSGSARATTYVLRAGKEFA